MKAQRVAAWAVGVLVVAFAAAAVADDDGAKKAAADEMKKFAGTWAPVAVEVNGMKLDEEMIKELRYVFKEDGTWKLTAGDNTVADGTFTVDPTKKPKTIDYKIVNSFQEEDKGKTSLGIYELDGDKLKVCRCMPAKAKRPDAFAAPADSMNLISEFKREKP